MSALPLLDSRLSFHRCCFSGSAYFASWDNPPGPWLPHHPPLNSCYHPLSPAPFLPLSGLPVSVQGLFNGTSAWLAHLGFPKVHQARNVLRETLISAGGSFAKDQGLWYHSLWTIHPGFHHWWHRRWRGTVSLMTSTHHHRLLPRTSDQQLTPMTIRSSEWGLQVSKSSERQLPRSSILIRIKMTLKNYRPSREAGRTCWTRCNGLPSGLDSHELYSPVLVI